MNHAELLSSLVESPVESQALEQAVLAFEFEDDLVTVVQAQGADGTPAVEVSVFVGQLPALDDSAVLETLRMLLHINGEGLLHHGWMIASDEDRVLTLRRVVPLQGLDQVQLEHWVSHGTERAAGLRALVEGGAVSSASDDPLRSTLGLATGGVSPAIKA